MDTPTPTHRERIRKRIRVRRRIRTESRWHIRLANAIWDERWTIFIWLCFVVIAGLVIYAMVTRMSGSLPPLPSN